MSGPAMFDANVLIYADDSTVGVKAELAREAIEALAASGRAVVTPQVLGEYWTICTRKLSRPIPADEAELRVRLYLNTMRLLPYHSGVILEAIRGVRRYGFPYYDAQIWASARLGGIGTVVTEDLSSGAEIEGVRFVDPFAADFDLDALLAG